MASCKVITIWRCKTIDDALKIRESYRNQLEDIEKLVVDLQHLNRKKPDRLLIGVLLNLRRYAGEHLSISLHFYPDYLPSVFRICKINHLFHWP